MAYPKINEENYKRIQTIRKKHNKAFYHIAGPHFTIVFPVFNYNLKAITAHVSKNTSVSIIIHFVLGASGFLSLAFGLVR